MELILEITDGGRKGSRFRIAEGMTIGRKQCDITVPDSKVSGKHAKVEVRDGGQVFLIDVGSSNGIKVGGKRTRELALAPGVIFQLGRTSFSVLEAEISEVTEDQSTWNDILAALLSRSKERAAMDKREASPFNPLLRLKFIQGIQTGTEWVLGYGPREAGSEIIDLRIEEAGAPQVCFEISPHRSGPRFRTQYSEIVKLNGKSLTDEHLQNGDIIEVHTTKIEVVLSQDD